MFSRGPFQTRQKSLVKVATTSLYRKIMHTCIVCPCLASILFCSAAFVSCWERSSFREAKLAENVTNVAYMYRSNFSTSLGEYSEDSVAGISYQVGDKLTMNIFNYHGGIWKTCLDISNEDRKRLVKADSPNSIDANYRNASCLNYLMPPNTFDKSQIDDFQKRYLKMQNNIIACTIVVLLCIISTIVIGGYSLNLMLVPGTMVTSVLYLTAAIFVMFTNIIYHIKASKINHSWGAKAPLLSLYFAGNKSDIPDMAQAVQLGWPIVVSWFSALIFLIAFFSWLLLTRLMNFETSKAFL